MTTQNLNLARTEQVLFTTFQHRKRNQWDRYRRYAS